jgi:putative ATPase
MTELFPNSVDDGTNRPLADLLRPQVIEDITGQDHLLKTGAPLRQMVDKKNLSSMIFWGPPGCGKTTMAKVIAAQSGLCFEELSAVFSGVSDLKKVFDSARIRKQNGKATLLFVDEIHRFNKSQQDAFLPVIENGTIVLIGATTENPSFELNAALLSRAQVFVLNKLAEESLDDILKRAEAYKGKDLPLDKQARQTLIDLASGDGRYALNLAEQIFGFDQPLDREGFLQIVNRRAPVYDKSGDSHYNLISALHKAVRGSDADAALYWYSRMVDAGEDLIFLARRMTRMASEDIGLADPQALSVCISAWQAYERVGSPEGDLILAQALVYLATAPKSNAVYTGYKKACLSAKKTGALSPPAHILNAPTQLMEQVGYGQGYVYDHDTPHGFSGQNYFPEDMKRENYYHPVDRGFEREIKKRLLYWEKLRETR